MTCAFDTRRRLLTRIGLVAAFATLPAYARAEQPFFIDIAQVPPARAADILDPAAAEGQFRTFLRLVRIAGYEDTLRGPGPFTLFAPTDTAFVRMPRAQFARLSEPRAHDELLTLLSYHVVAGR